MIQFIQLHVKEKLIQTGDPDSHGTPIEFYLIIQKQNLINTVKYQYAEHSLLLFHCLSIYCSLILFENVLVPQ